jgi:hypothetical protein
MDLEIQYRLWRRQVPPPQRIRLEVPGWAGTQDDTAAQPWECKPFVDGSTLGLELRWGLRSSIIVSSRDGVNAHFQGDFATETACPTTFAQFAPYHYGVNMHMAIKTPPGWGLMVLPHPKWFASPYTTSIPYALPGIIEFDWWPLQFFIVCRVPPPGLNHIFNYGDPVAQLIPVPTQGSIRLEEMTREQAQRSAQEEQFIRDQFMALSTVKRTMSSGKQFGNVYRVLGSEFRKQGRIDWESHARQLGVQFPTPPDSPETAHAASPAPDDLPS